MKSTTLNKTIKNMTDVEESESYTNIMKSKRKDNQ
jgi:hypothetical protein